MAHIGEEKRLALIGGLCRFLGPAQLALGPSVLGDVDIDADDATFAGLRFPDPDVPAAANDDLEGIRGVAVAGKPLGDPVAGRFIVAEGFEMRLHVNHVFGKLDARSEQLGGLGQNLAQQRVTQHQPVVAVPDREAGAHLGDRIAQAREAGVDASIFVAHDFVRMGENAALAVELDIGGIDQIQQRFEISLAVERIGARPDKLAFEQTMHVRPRRSS